tara:strand:- start:70 stop:219 length:150 start_codon:yes stop_codon:yes gene_type:complete
VDTPSGVVPLQHHTDNNNGHKDIEHMLHMVLVVLLQETESVAVMDVKES